MKDELRERKIELEKYIRRAEKILNQPVKGNLEIAMIDGHYRYYLRSREDGKLVRKYLKNSEIEIARIIAERDYARQVLKRAKKELSKLKAFEETYEAGSMRDVYMKMIPGRRILVEPIEPTDEMFEEEWRKGREGGKNSFPFQNEIFTDLGEQVRSKSEKIIADKLYKYGIPYVYESEIWTGKKVIYPDFVVLNRRTRNEYIWEHLGMIDRSEYVMKNSEKLVQYQKYGYIPGINLIITYETAAEPISTSVLDRLITQFLL